MDKQAVSIETVQPLTSSKGLVVHPAGPDNISQVTDYNSSRYSFCRLAASYFLFLIATFAICLSIASVQVLDGEVPEFEQGLLRFGIQLIFTLPVAAFKLKWKLHITRSLWIHMGISVVSSFLVNLMIFLSTYYLAVGTVGGVMNGMIIVFNGIIALVVKTERQSHLFISMILALIGLFFLIQPEFVFSHTGLYRAPTPNWTSPCVSPDIRNTSHSAIRLTSSNETTNSLLGCSLLALTAVCFLVNARAVAKLVKVVDPFVCNFHVGLWCALLNGALMMILETPTIPEGNFCLMLLLMYAFGAAFYSTSIPLCLQYIPPAIFSVMYTFEFVILTCFQYTFLHSVRPGKGNWVEVVGCVICLAGCIVTPAWQLNQERKKARNIAAENKKMDTNAMPLKSCTVDGHVDFGNNA